MLRDSALSRLEGREHLAILARELALKPSRLQSEQDEDQNEKDSGAQ
jgi:hypothetical protein